MNNSHFQRNLKQYEIAQKIPTPEQVGKMEEPPMLGLIYKAIFYCLSVLLDIRHNTSNVKKVNKYTKPVKKVDNAVIKDNDIKKGKIFLKGVIPNDTD